MAAPMHALAGAIAVLWLGFGGTKPPPDFPSRFATGPAPYAIPPPGSYLLPPLRPAPDGEVLDDTGKAQRLSALLGGKVTLVSFVYLLCGDANGCPMAIGTLFDIWHASEQVPGLRDKVQLMTLSFDPERDTPEALASFAWPIRADGGRARKIDWKVLTTADQARLSPLLAGFGQTVDKSGDNDRLNHLLRMFLVDAQGQIRNVYGLGMIDPQLMMTDVATLLQEEQAE